jgi:TolA-binding protein
MLERAAPPLSAPNKKHEHRDADDRTLLTSKIIVTPDNTSGSSGSFPSSAMPSPTNPQFSWREKLEAVRNQEACGSCWAFAVVGAYEGSQSLQSNLQYDMAEQQLVNCVPTNPLADGDNCHGNMPATALDWMAQNGTPFEQALPYRATMSSCNSSIDRSEHSWNEFKSKDLVVASKSYRAAARDRFTEPFTKARGSPDPDDVFTSAMELKDDKKLADARDQFALFVELFPEDSRVHEARFWNGWAENQLGQYWDAIQDLYDMIPARPKATRTSPTLFITWATRTLPSATAATPCARSKSTPTAK